MDSGKDMAVDNLETTQPVDAVPAETEVSTQAQSDNEEVEIFVEGEGDQLYTPKGGMSDAQARAAFKEEREKRKKKAEELALANDRADKLERRLAELEGKVTEVTAKPKPKLSDFDYDETAYEKAVDEWYTGSRKATDGKKTEQVTSPVVELNEDQEFHAHKAETELRKQIKDYDKAVDQVKGELAKFYPGNAASAVNQIYANAHAFGIDPAKAIFALSRLGEAAYLKLVRTRTPYELANALRELESKVQTRQKQKIDTKPEPEFNQSGPVDNSNAAIAKAREAWTKATDPVAQANAWATYQRLKKSKGNK